MINPQDDRGPSPPHAASNPAPYPASSPAPRSAAPHSTHRAVRSAEVILPCTELEQTLPFFTERLGFRVETIIPADDPALAVIAGHGLRLALERGGSGDPGHLRLRCDDPETVGGGERALTAPNGTRITLVEAEQPLVVPPLAPSLVITRLDRTGANDAWISGRAGMAYRDLIPDRQGGRFAASHIAITEGGAVPDYVHYHRVRFQMIFCQRGWVKVAYEDQGSPRVLRPGDCVLQPPTIRHRVLECSPGLEVVELSCPASHETHGDLELALPTGRQDPERLFAGQRFVHHVAADDNWTAWTWPGWRAQDLELAEATGGLASAHRVRPGAQPNEQRSCAGLSHNGELRFAFLRAGTLTLRCAGHEPVPLAAGDAWVVPSGLEHALEAASDDAELLLVDLPAVSAPGACGGVG